MYYNANGRWFQVLSISRPLFVHFFRPPGIQWPYAVETGGERTMEQDLDDWIFGGQSSAPSNR